MFGLDSAGRPVNAPATTIDVSRRGARVAGLAAWNKPGEIIGVRHGQEKARYQVVWVGQPETPQQGQIGLMCVEIGKVIWSTAVAQSKAAAADGASDTGSFHASQGIARTEPGPPTGSFRSQGASAAAGPNRRHETRYLVEGGLHVREQGALAGQWATVHDISLGGCYVETVSPLPLDAHVEATLHIGDFQFQAHGVVAKVDPLTGMAIRFTDISPVHRARLETLIAMLAQNAPQV